MQIIDLREWVLTDLKRVKRSIFQGNKSRTLPKRALHIQRILSVYAKQEFNTVTVSLPSGPRPASFFIDDQKYTFKSHDWYFKPDDNI